MAAICQQFQIKFGSILRDVTTIDHNIHAGGIAIAINCVDGAIGCDVSPQNAPIHTIERAAHIGIGQRILGC